MKNYQEHATEIMAGIVEDITEGGSCMMGDRDFLASFLYNAFDYKTRPIDKPTLKDLCDLACLYEAWRHQPTPTDEIAEEWADVLVTLEWFLEIHRILV